MNEDIESHITLSKKQKFWVVASLTLANTWFVFRSKGDEVKLYKEGGIMLGTSKLTVEENNFFKNYLITDNLLL